MHRVIFLFYFLSGFSALIYEVSWVRELSLVLGNTAQATSVVLAVFLGGLALGSLLCGKASKQLDWRPLAAYGRLEIAVGFSAILVSQAFKLAPPVYIWFYQHLPGGMPALLSLRLLVAASVLLIPTMLMGATLPVMVGYLERFGLSSKMFSFLYGINTLGAAAGSLCACFLGFAYIGLQATMLCAAAINIVIGVFSIYLESHPEAATAQPAPSMETKKVPGIPADSAAMPIAWLCAISFMTGFTALSYEVLWTRILRFFVTSLTYSFTIMISTFLLGLAVGAFVYERYIQRAGSADKQMSLHFAIVQLLAALACALSIPILLLSSDVDIPLQHLGLLPHHRMFSEPQYQLFYIMLVSWAAILVPAILLGILFPMIGTLAANRHKEAVDSVGTVYAFNTVGCVMGSLMTGLVLMPATGSYTAFQWIVFLSTLTGAAALLMAKRIQLSKRFAFACLVVGIAGLYIYKFHVGINSSPDRRVLAVGEDVTGAMMIVSIPKMNDIRMIFNGSPLATTIPTSLRYMRLLGHLPVLLHPHPTDVLLGCFGTGTTCNAAAMHQDVKNLDLVELSKMVLNAAPIFRKTNHDVLQNPKIHKHINDVRNYLLTTDKSYDVITFEPPPPSEAGIVNLYTSEFYALVNRHLNNDGIICQWVPMDQDSIALWKMMVASARKVFPHITIWLTNNREAVLMASRQPVKFDFASLQQRIDESPRIKGDLEEVGLGSPMALLSTYVISGSALDNYLGGAIPISDDHPALEFYLPWAGPLTHDIDLESAGLSDLRRFVRAQSRCDGFDVKEFARNWQAVHLLRLSQATSSQAEADHYIDSALTLMPKTPWSQFVNEHRELFYKPDGD